MHDRSQGISSMQWSRRQWLSRAGAGAGMLGLAALLQDERLLGNAAYAAT